jgi:hypothetical protein
MPVGRSQAARPDVWAPAGRRVGAGWARTGAGRSGLTLLREPSRYRFPRAPATNPPGTAVIHALGSRSGAGWAAGRVR